MYLKYDIKLNGGYGLWEGFLDIDIFQLYSIIMIFLAGMSHVPTPPPTAQPPLPAKLLIEVE